jgi:hypothetical protein
LREFLVPHRICRNLVKLTQAPRWRQECGPGHRVAERNLRFHVVQEYIHPRHRECRRIDLLPGEARRFRFSVCPVLFPEAELTLDKQAGRPAGGVVNLISRFGIKHARHQDGDFARRVKLARTLPLPFGELPQ